MKGEERKVQKSIDIVASPQRIWPFLVEPEKIMQWCFTFTKFEYTGDQREGVGTPIYIEEKASGPLMMMYFKIAEWKENEKIGLRMVSGASLKTYEQSWSLEPTSSGSRFTFMEIVELPWGVIGKLIGVFLEGGSAATVDKMLVKLKGLVEE
ncbi:MAG: SRPBCC family protein [Anaerolineales bacterium]|nr:SRPBCC family protein [Anaerolineales bacterium]